MKMKETNSEYKMALVYCRVSSRTQVLEGHGLDSQEFRCMERAKQKGLRVIKVFREEGVSGKLFDRPAMGAMMNYLDKHPKERFVIIFDDLKRFARDTGVYLKLKTELVINRKVKYECLNFDFEDSPAGRFIENVMAGAAQLEREQNAEQVRNRMRARYEAGIWPFSKPPGMRRIKDPVYGMLLAPEEPFASIYKEAIEKYRDFEINTYEEVKTFILRKYADHGISKKMSISMVNRILTEILFCGYQQCKRWGVPPMKAKHEGFISYETYQAVQKKLAKSAKPRLRKDYRADFPLRNFVKCAVCKTALTGSWHRGRNKNKKYKHYFCRTIGCEMRNKAVRGEVMEKRFERLLLDMRPSKKVVELTEAILKDVWATKQKDENKIKGSIKKEMDAVQSKIQSCVDRISKTDNQILIENYEKEILTLVDKKTALEAELMKNDYASDQFGTAAEAVFEYVKMPDIQWQNPSYAKKRMLLSMYFGRGIEYHRDTGFGTPELPLILAKIGARDAKKGELVELAGIAPASKGKEKRHLQA